MIVIHNVDIMRNVRWSVLLPLRLSEAGQYDIKSLEGTSSCILYIPSSWLFWSDFVANIALFIQPPKSMYANTEFLKYIIRYAIWSNLNIHRLLIYPSRYP